MKQSVSVIIPAFNEATTITNPIQSALDTKGVDQIVIIDDGSHDETASIVREYLGQHPTDTQVDFIVHDQNKGKSAAIQTALSHITAPTVLMLDADIKDLQPTVLEAFITAYFERDARMAIYYKYDEHGLTEKIVDMITGAEMLLCGERLVETQILRDLSELESLGYALEIRLNQYCIDHQKKILLFRGPYFYHVIKQKKQNYSQLSGLWANVKMTKQIIAKSSIGTYFRQKRYFSKLLSEAVWYKPAN